MLYIGLCSADYAISVSNYSKRDLYGNASGEFPTYGDTNAYRSDDYGYYITVCESSTPQQQLDDFATLLDASGVTYIIENNQHA